MATDTNKLVVIDQNSGEQVTLDLSDFNELKVEDSYMGPPSHMFAITPNDSTDLSNETRGIYVGVAGNIALITAGGETGTLTNVAAGGILAIRATRILTGTTATGLWGFY